MLILNNTTDSLEVILEGAITTNQLDCTASFHETTATTFERRTSDVSTNGTTAVTLVSAPPSSTQRVIEDVSIFNTDTANAVVVIRYNRNGTFRRLFQVTLAPNEKLQYTDKNGWGVYSTSGAIKQSINQGSNAISAGLNLVVLSADVINNNAVANTLQDVTGLSFPINAGKTYYFRFFFRYDAPNIVNGSRWTVNTVGATTITSISYQSHYGLNLTTNTVNVLNAPDFPTAANSSSPYISNSSGWIEGIITAGTDGSLILRFASEVANGAITAKVGSLVYWQEVL